MIEPDPGGGAAAGGGSASATGPAAAADRSATEKVVNWANWTLYLDKSDDGKHYPTLEAFQKKTGIKATYAEDIEDNDTYYGKIQAQLKQGQDIGKDVIVLTDWMAGRLVRQGYAQQFDDSAIPNERARAFTRRATSATAARGAPRSAAAPASFSASTVAPTPRRPAV